jgi:hypothetical protein
MAPNRNLDQNTRERIIAANSETDEPVAADFGPSRLVPQRVNASTARYRLAGELLIRNGITDRNNQAEVEEASVGLLSLSQDFAELTPDERREYSKFLGGNLLTQVAQMSELVDDYSGSLYRDRMTEFSAFMGYVVSRVAEPEVSLPEAI